MKIIPKYLTAWGPLELLFKINKVNNKYLNLTPEYLLIAKDWYNKNIQNNKFRENINWINGDNYDNWVKRDSLGRPLEDNSYYQYGSVTKNQQKTGTYEHDRNYGKNDTAYEDYSWWNGYGDLTNNSEENLKSFFQQYVNRAKASGKPMKWISYLENYLKDGKWTPFTTVNGRTFNTPQKFRDYYAYDRLGSTAHNTNSGEVYYDSEGNTYNSLPKEYEEFDPESIIYDSENNDDKEENYKIRNLFRNWKNFYLNQNRITDSIVRFRPIQKKTTYPIDSELTQAKKDVLENINPESNPVDTGNPQKKVRGAIKGIPGWAKGIGKIFGGIGKGISDLFKGDGKPVSPFWSLFMRTINDNAFNLRNTEQLIKNMDVPLLNYTPVYRLVHGDYIALLLAQREASRLRTSQPITANLLIQTATDLEGILKGNQLIEQGNAKDAQMYWNTAEKAFQQSKENAAGWDATANKNKLALSEFNNKIAELRYKALKDNMQNWDTLLADMERRKWKKWDRDEYLKLQNQEELDNLYDTKTGQGVDYEALKALREKMLGETDKATLAELNKLAGAITDRMSARTIYNRLRRLGMYDESKFKDMFPGYNFGKGGILAFLQKGGGFGVIAASSAGEGNPYLAQLGKEKKSTASSSTSATSRDEDEKTKDKLLNNIADTLKGIDGLNSDVNILYLELVNFFDVLRYVGDFIDDPMQYYSMYIRALNRVNQVKQSAKAFDSAYKELETKHSLDSPAIDPNGYVYVGIGKTNEIKKVTPDEYLNNTDKYKLLRNSDLLYLRRNNPNYAFGDTYIDDISHSGTNIEDIYKFIKDILGKVGTDKLSRDTIIQLYGNGAVQGLQELSDLVQQGAANPETAKIIAGLTGTLTEVNTSIESLVERAKLALLTISSILPRNMYSLLLLHSGSKENVGKLLTSIVFQGLSTNTTFKINGITQLDEQGNPKSGTRAGSGSGSGSKPDDPKTTTATKWVQGYGAKSTFTIVGGKNIGWTVSGNTMPVTDNSDKQLGLTTLLELSSGWGGTLDLRHAYMGNSRISSLGLSQVLLEDGDITLVALPIYNGDTTKPAFERLKKLSEANKKLKDQNIDVGLRENLSSDLKKTVNKVYEEYKLDPLFNDDGSVNKMKFAYFGLIKGITKETAFEEGDEFTRDYLIEATEKERKLFEDIMKSNPKTKDFSISDGVLGLGWGADRVYRGTIFIPVNTNIMSTQAGYGSSYATDGNTDLMYDTKLQRHDAELAQGGVHLDRVSDKRNFQFE